MKQDSYGIGARLFWGVCPDGARIVDYGELPPLQPEKTILEQAALPSGVYVFNRSDRIEPYERAINDRSSGSMLEAFINCRTDEDIAAFVTRHGMIGTARIEDRQAGLAPIWEFHAGFKLMVEFAGRREYLPALGMYNALADNRAIRIRPSFDPPDGKRTRPRFGLTAETPYSFMMAEASLMIASETELRVCANCGRLFLAGNLASKRTNALYCSNRCRVAMQRAELKAEAVTPGD